MRFATEHGHYELNAFPGSNQIVVATHSFIDPRHRGQGYGGVQAREKLETATELGYDYMLAAIIEGNEPQLRIADRLKYEWLAQFENSVTGNRVNLFGKALR